MHVESLFYVQPHYFMFFEYFEIEIDIFLENEQSNLKKGKH